MNRDSEYVCFLTDEGTARFQIRRDKYSYPHPDPVLIEALLVQRDPITEFNLNGGATAADFLKDLNEHVFSCEPCNDKLLDFRERARDGTKGY